MPLFFGTEEERLWINMQLDSGKIDTREALKQLSAWTRSRIDTLAKNIEDRMLRERQQKKLASIRAHIT